MTAGRAWAPALLKFWLLALAVLCSADASAQTRALTEIETRQYLLIWAGNYLGLVDGVWGPKSDEALTRWYLERYGRVPSYLSTSQRDDLIQDAAAAVAEAGFVVERDSSLDVTFAFPSSLLAPWPQDHVAARAFRSPDGRALLTVEYLGGRYVSLDQLYRIRSRIAGRMIEYEYFTSGWFVISGTESGQDFYERYAGKGEDLRGFSVRYPTGEGSKFSPAVVAMSNLFRPTARANDPLISFAENLPEQLIDVSQIWNDCVQADDVGARIRACTKIVSLKDPRGFSLHVAYYERATALASQRRWDSAIRDYSAAIRIQPNYAEAYYGRAEAYRETGPDHYGRALTDYHAAVRLLPSSHPWRTAAEQRIAQIKRPPGASAVLYEEPPPGAGADTSVTSVNAAVTWRYVNDGPHGPEIEANLDVPDRNMSIKFSLHKNLDDTLPASHLIEVVVDKPVRGRAIDSIPRIVLKPTEGARGQALVGAAAKVADGFFWIALSAADNDIAANLSLIRERNWIDLPFVYENGQRAILTFEKGPAGAEVFRRAEALWDLNDTPSVAPAPSDQFQIAVTRKAIELRATADAAARRASALRKRLLDLEADSTANQEALDVALAEAEAKDAVAVTLRGASVELEDRVAAASEALDRAQKRAADAEAAHRTSEVALSDAEAALVAARSNRDKARTHVESVQADATEAVAAAMDAEVIATTMREATRAIAGDAGVDPKSSALVAAAARAERDARERQTASRTAAEGLEMAKTELERAETVVSDAAGVRDAARDALALATTAAEAAHALADRFSQALQAREVELAAARAVADNADADAKEADATVRRYTAERASLAASVDRARADAEQAETESQIAEAAAVTAEALAGIIVPRSDEPLTLSPRQQTPAVGPFTGGGIVVDTSTRRIGGREVAWVTVKGIIKPGDDAYFNRALLTIDAPVVFVSLESPGGDVETGIKIGRTIWNNQYQTVVEGAECYSMCAYIWLAGRPRYMSPSAKIGFHAPWRGAEGDKVEVSSVGSAIVGGYLADLGFTAAAMAYMTAPGPSDFQVLTPADAERLAIYMQPWQQ
jgi:tetratricopeptide (TPR) repeat protein